MEQARWSKDKVVVRVQAVWVELVPQASVAIVFVLNAVIANRMNEAFPVCRKNARNAGQL
jgi:hypothetical protein